MAHSLIYDLVHAAAFESVGTILAGIFAFPVFSSYFSAIITKGLYLIRIDIGILIGCFEAFELLEDLPSWDLVDLCGCKIFHSLGVLLNQTKITELV